MIYNRSCLFTPVVCEDIYNTHPLLEFSPVICVSFVIRHSIISGPKCHSVNRKKKKNHYVGIPRFDSEI